jgi:hypothetical protein
MHSLSKESESFVALYASLTLEQRAIVRNALFNNSDGEFTPGMVYIEMSEVDSDDSWPTPISTHTED